MGDLIGEADAAPPKRPPKEGGGLPFPRLSPGTAVPNHPVSIQTEDFKRVLARDYWTSLEVEGTTYWFEIYEGTVYSPSIPWAFTPIVPTSRCWPAALVHDVLYKFQGFVDPRMMRLLQKVEAPSLGRPTWAQVPVVSRRLADKFFLAFMEKMEVSWLRRELAYRAVRLGGRPVWIELPDRGLWPKGFEGNRAWA